MSQVGDSHGIQAFYYPLAHVEEDYLKQMLLYLDSVHVQYPRAYLGPRDRKLYEFWESTRLLQKEGLVVPIHTHSIPSEVLQDKIRQHLGVKWAARRRPKRAAETLRLLNAMLLSESFQDSLAQKVSVVLGLETGIYSALAPGTVPVTASEVAHDEFNRNISSLMMTLGEDMPGALCCDQSMRTQLLSRVFQSYLPSLSLKTYEDVLEVRTRLREEITLVREEIGKLTSDIAVTPLTDGIDFIEQGQARVDRAVKELTRKVRSATTSTLRKITQEVVVGGVAISATVASGVPWPLLFLLNSAKNIANEVGSLLEAKAEIKQKNALSLLVSLRHRV
jgi:hypothetical protein